MDNAPGNSHETLFGQVEEGIGGHEQATDLPAIAEADAPIIGIPLPVEQWSQGPQLVADAVGLWAVERLHGRVFLLPLWPSPPHARRYHALWPLLPLMDGLLFPARLAGPSGEEHEPSQLRGWSMVWEMALAQLATVVGMPLLAIGDGAYRWHLALKGALQQAELLTPVLSSPVPWERCSLRVQATSSLARWIEQVPTPEEPGLTPWTLPLQALPAPLHLALGIRPCAHADDGRLVAFERADPSFGLGILARLDWGLDQRHSVAVFAQFFQAARAFARQRAEQQPRWESSRERICASLSQQGTQGHPVLLTTALPAPEARSEQSAARRSPSPPQARPERVRVRSSPPSRQALNAMRRRRWNTSERRSGRQ